MLLRSKFLAISSVGPIIHLPSVYDGITGGSIQVSSTGNPGTAADLCTGITAPCVYNTNEGALAVGTNGGNLKVCVCKSTSNTVVAWVALK